MYLTTEYKTYIQGVNCIYQVVLHWVDEINYALSRIIAFYEHAHFLFIKKTTHHLFIKNPTTHISLYKI